jgi:hypothetical protein
MTILYDSTKPKFFNINFFVVLMNVVDRTTSAEPVANGAAQQKKFCDAGLAVEFIRMDVAWPRSIEILHMKTTGLCQ